MNNKELLLNAIEDVLDGGINQNYALCENICKKSEIRGQVLKLSGRSQSLGSIVQEM